MAAASYTEDLTDITLAENTTNWSALGGGASGLGAGADFAMQGTNCVDKQVSSSEKGQIFNFGSAITPAANTHFFVWTFLATPGLASTLVNRGLAIILGTGTTAYNAFHVEGSDTYGAEGRVGKCYPVRYVTSSNGSVPYRTLTGSPGANPQYFGATANITAAVKSSNLGVDAIRHGTGAYITGGEIVGLGPATFAGFASQNDAIANRWGIFTSAGGGYELQGKFVVGQNSGKTPTAAEFQDSNVFITFPDTPHTLTDFTELIIDHTDTIFNLDTVTFKALGSHNPGKISFLNTGIVSSYINVTHEGMGTTIFVSGCTVERCSWLSANSVTQAGATIDDCTFVDNIGAAALIVDNLNLVNTCSFTSSGTGHAVRLTSIGAGSLTWNHSISGYAGTNGSTGNEALWVDVGSGTLTLNVPAGITAPSIRTSGATVNVVTGQVTTTFNLSPNITGYEWRLYENSVSAGIIGTIALAGEESSIINDQSYTYAYTVDTDAVFQVIATGYEESLTYFTLGNTNQTIGITLIPEQNI